MRRRYSTVSVSVDVDVSEVISEMDDEDLEAFGLKKLAPGNTTDDFRAELYQAAESGNCAAMLRTIEVMARELDGRILVTRMAA